MYSYIGCTIVVKKICFLWLDPYEILFLQIPEMPVKKGFKTIQKNKNFNKIYNFVHIVFFPLVSIDLHE